MTITPTTTAHQFGLPKLVLSLRQTTSFLTANSHFAYGGLLRSLLITILFLLTGITGVWGQAYYAIHQNGKGYLRVNGEASVSLTNHATFYYGNIFSNDGSSLWVYTSDGYLKNNYFYLNVANNNTLYLSVDPVTQWTLEDISGKAKKHIKIKTNCIGFIFCKSN